MLTFCRGRRPISQEITQRIFPISVKVMDQKLHSTCNCRRDNEGSSYYLKLSFHPLWRCPRAHCLSHCPAELSVVNNDWFENKRKVQIWANKWMQSSSGMRNSWQLPWNNQLCTNMDMVTGIIIMHFASSITVIISCTGQIAKVKPAMLWHCLCHGSSPGGTEQHLWVTGRWRIENTHLCLLSLFSISPLADVPLWVLCLHVYPGELGWLPLDLLFAELRNAPSSWMESTLARGCSSRDKFGNFFFCPLSTYEEQVVNTKSLVLISARLITEYLWKAGT